MIFQIFLISACVGLIVYAYQCRRLSLISSLTVMLMAVGGIFMAAFPEVTSYIANQLNVGRGTDLILYLYVVLSVAVLFRYFILFQEIDRKLTILARNDAIAHALDLTK